MKIAILPWSDFFLNDRLFEVDNPQINRDFLLNPYVLMKNEFERNGDELHTIDVYDIREVDWFLFFIWDKQWYRKITKIKKVNRIIYCNTEPPVVDERNTPEGMCHWHKYMPYILTWNKDCVNNKYIFHKNAMYYYCVYRPSQVSFEDKSLVTMISGNKKSKVANEMYSERVAAIRFFEKELKEKFVFYGMGWNKKEYPSYGGEVKDKAEIYHNYRFAICYENMCNVNGYITEKLFDCLCAGVVPIYAGPNDIDDYVPRDCYIAWTDFNDYKDLYDYMISMDEKTYNKYLQSAKDYILSEQISFLSGDNYAKDIYKVINSEYNYHMSIYARFVLFKDYIKEKVLHIE